ncbi:LuxR family transcriptional regulator [Bradyrhizobium sp. WSM3983]|uniref:LuxR family transcriptional regulator n=1 Tax=Bradyrhizobium sp. WSM3983 TaxID=1038867 RepID=UPI0004864746|nr:LuxR family transcriptional regulator [Bradyrhizobium sp. WSM3983]
MHRIFQNFIDRLACADDAADFSEAMAAAARGLELSCFAYLALPGRPKGKPRLISTYPKEWISHYLQSRYELIDPVIAQAIQTAEPFQWGIDTRSSRPTPVQHQLLDEAAQFGIRFGFTVPIHDGHGPIAALTFANYQRSSIFEHRVESQARVLQLMAMYFHAHVRRKLASEHKIAGILLSPREFECLEWASQGKSAWEIGQILDISRNTVASYLESAKKKLGVRTVVQAATRLAAAKKQKQN